MIISPFFPFVNTFFHFFYFYFSFYIKPTVIEAKYRYIIRIFAEFNRARKEEKQNPMSQKSLSALLTLLLCITLMFTACHRPEKQITVVIREAGSGTREAFDRIVTDGVHFLEEREANGKKIYRSAADAVVQTKSGTLLSSVAYDKNAIGYLSLASVNDRVKVLAINGIAPTTETVASGAYPIARPFVIMTTNQVPLSPLAADFLDYLKSDLAEASAIEAGVTFLSNPTMRANPNASPVPVTAYRIRESLPEGRVVVRGSTSLERMITAAIRSYCTLYDVDPIKYFDVQLEGSSIGRKNVENDRAGNVIGLSSADVSQDSIDSLRLCLDAIAVIVHREREDLTNLSLDELYGIFSGKIRSFAEIRPQGARA